MRITIYYNPNLNASKALIAVVILLTMSWFPSLLKAESLLPVGSGVPEIQAIDQDGKTVNLGEILNHETTLLYFYPKANTPGCTAQACSLRDSIDELKSLNVRVIGVSKDSPKALKKFEEKYQLPFMLIADENSGVADAFGVASLLGMTHRTSFLIKDGKIVNVFPKAKTAGHAAEVIEALKAH